MPAYESALERIKTRVYAAFGLGQEEEEPAWFVGLYERQPGEPEGADLVLELDIGRFPLVLCGSDDERSRRCADELCLVIPFDCDDRAVRREVWKTCRRVRQRQGE